MIEEITNREDLSQISLTGARSLVLLGLLMQEPRSLEDIRNKFLEFNLIEDSNSDDILRIDINTLRSMGCLISRADHRTNNKYVLLDHPFKIDINEEELSLLKRTFNKLKENTDISLLLSYDELFKKISEFVSDKDIIEKLYWITPLKNYSRDIVDKLNEACQKHKTVKILYKTPASPKETEIEIITDKVILQNNKLYLYGIDKNSKQAIYLNIRRILKFLSQSDSNDNVTVSPVTVKFLLHELGIPGLEESEKILSGDLDNGFIIEGKYHNEFFAIQRILSFGSKCIVLEPNDFKDKVIDTLKKMKEIYNG